MICLRPGQHRLEARLAGFEPAAQTVEVAVGPPQLIELPLTTAEKPPAKPAVPAADSDGGPSLALGATGLALGGAGVIAGVALLVASAVSAGTVADLQDEIAADPAAPEENPCGAGPTALPQCAQLSDATDDAATLRSAGIGVLVSGVVVLGGALLYLLLPREEGAEAPAAARLAPLVDRHQAGVLLTGSF